MRFSPTPGEATRTVTLRLGEHLLRADPHRCSSAGVAIAPAQTMTSRVARCSRSVPSGATVRTPTARSPSKMIESANSWCSTVRIRALGHRAVQVVHRRRRSQVGVRGVPDPRSIPHPSPVLAKSSSLFQFSRAGGRVLSEPPRRRRRRRGCVALRDWAHRRRETCRKQRPRVSASQPSAPSATHSSVSARSGRQVIMVLAVAQPPRMCMRA